jgi:ATP-dependent DNA helicase PIF1
MVILYLQVCQIYHELRNYLTGLFNFAENKMEALKKKSVLNINEVSMVDGRLLDYISSVFVRLKGNNKSFGNIYVIVFGDMIQLPPVDGIKVFKATVWKPFHPLFLKRSYRQNNQRFFNVLNKIRFGIVDNEVKEVLTQCWQQYNPLQSIWNITYLCSLCKEADAMNYTVLSGMPQAKAVSYNTVDIENGERVSGTEFSRIFKLGTNFPSIVIYNIGAKVIFLTNNMLVENEISNSSIGIIINILDNDDIEAVFPT